MFQTSRIVRDKLVETDFGHPYPTDFGQTDFAKPILAKEKVSVVCKDFGFGS